MTDEKLRASTGAGVMAFAACEMLVENSICENDDDGQAHCSVCTTNIGEPGDLITSEIMANAEHEDWCPVSMASKALEAWKAAMGKL